MEIRARYVLIGLFTLAVILLGFGFVYWLQGTAGLHDRTLYRVRFENSVSGLLKGSAVVFNGVRVGEVLGLELSAENPRQVIATIAVDRATPVHADTEVGLEFGGVLGGTAAVTLAGGTPTSPIPSARRGEPPLLVADATAGQTMTQVAREALRRLNTILADNADALHTTITNLETFSGVLARNSDRLDGILAGIERMTGAAPAKPPPVYDLTAPHAFPAAAKPPRGQLVVPEPTALVTLETQKIIIRSNGGETSFIDNGQWSDSLPKLLQAKVVQSFENANYLRTVARPFEGLAGDYQLLIDIRSFQISHSGEVPAADVEFAVKILGNNGRIVDARIFRASVPAKATNAPAAAAALDEAFGKAAVDLVVWASGVLQNH
jgi:phospholipid/cholesterol/gamma-HCH transport system substrate-binding protein